MKHPNLTNTKDGIQTFTFDEWIDLYDFLSDRADRTQYIWRGQRDLEWLLEPSMRRQFRKGTISSGSDIQSVHLKQFKYAVRGRRGQNPRPIPGEGEDEWWSLGQHHGLATPLLDWSHSPFVAIFFAFAEAEKTKSSVRVIYGLSQSAVKNKSEEILQKWKDLKGQFISKGQLDAVETLGLPETIDLVRPMTDENSRLISQNGLFTKSPLTIDIETWIKKNYKGDAFPRLYKILIKERERENVLKNLNRMNINYLTLYPDIMGASNYCNMALEIEKYAHDI
jgi:hypothetical protein